MIRGLHPRVGDDEKSGTLSSALSRLRTLPSRLAAARAASKLVAAARYAEAEAILEPALAVSPEARSLLVLFATCAHSQGNYAAALERWETVRRLYPKVEIAWSGMAANARERGDVGFARTIIVEALSRFPRGLFVGSEAARVFDRNGEPNEAVKHWRRLCHTGRNTDWHASLAKTLLQLDRLDEADTITMQGLRLDPDHMGLKQARGLVAMAQEKWDEALAVWSDLALEYPADEVPRAYLMRIRAIQKLAEAEAGRGSPVPGANRGSEEPEQEVMRKAMLRFEGIGIDCEFGTIQRYFGAEPLGLLRWNDTNCRALMAALGVGFEGIGEPANTELTTGTFGEYYLRDKRWGLDMHTCLYSHETAAETLFPKMCRRMSYLRDKFLEDLATAEKILVYKSQESLEEIIALHEAFKAFGPIRMLHVRRAADNRKAPGELQQLRPDLQVGFVERTGDLHNIAYDDWKSICLSTLDGRLAGTSPAEAGR